MNKGRMGNNTRRPIRRPRRRKRNSALAAFEYGSPAIMAQPLLNRVNQWTPRESQREDERCHRDGPKVIYFIRERAGKTCYTREHRIRRQWAKQWELIRITVHIVADLIAKSASYRATGDGIRGALRKRSMTMRAHVGQGFVQEEYAVATYRAYCKNMVSFHILLNT